MVILWSVGHERMCKTMQKVCLNHTKQEFVLFRINCLMPAHNTLLSRVFKMQRMRFSNSEIQYTGAKQFETFQNIRSNCKRIYLTLYFAEEKRNFLLSNLQWNQSKCNDRILISSTRKHF